MMENLYYTNTPSNTLYMPDLKYDISKKLLYVGKDFCKFSSRDVIKKPIYVFPEGLNIYNKYSIRIVDDFERANRLFLYDGDTLPSKINYDDPETKNLLTYIYWEDVLEVQVEEGNDLFYTTDNKNLYVKYNNRLILTAYDKKDTYILPDTSNSYFCGDYPCRKFIYNTAYIGRNQNNNNYFQSSYAKDMVYIDNTIYSGSKNKELAYFINKENFPNLNSGFIYTNSDYQFTFECLDDRDLLSEDSNYKFVLGFAESSNKLNKSIKNMHYYENIIMQKNESCNYKNFDKLYESAVNEGKISDFINKVFANCQTKEDKIKRLLKLVSAGVISLSIAFWLVGNSITQNKAESDQIKKELVEVSSKGEKVSQIERKQSNFGNFNDKVVFGTDWKISDEGIAHILGTEKYRAKPYYATEHERKMGKVSIGYGHVIKDSDPKWIREAKHITEEQALEIFKMDMEYFEAQFERQVVPYFDKRLQNAETMPQAVIDVMLSMAYNAGIAGFKKEDNNPFYASMKKCRYDKITGKINKQDYDYSISKLPQSLVKQGGNVLPGLVNRRKAEYKYANV